MAHDAGVVGKAAVPPLLRAGLAAVGLFAVGGLGLTRLLLPGGLRRHEALWVLPVGACAVALCETVLGFARVPFHLNLALTIAAGVVVAAVAWRRGGRSLVPEGMRRAGWPAYVAVLLAAVALIPLFRAGFATVEGDGQDAHLAVGTAQFLQHHPPTAVAIAEPVDRVPLVWRSKQPIYYALGSVASLSGLEPYQTLAPTAAVMLALAAIGFFLLARELLGAGTAAAIAAMALVGLDRMVLHTVMHPYFNQTWGFFTLPFALVLSWWAVRERTRGGLALLALFLAIGAFAYPLALPIPLVALAVFLWPERGRLSPRRLYHGRRSLLWMVPLGLVLIVPLAGVAEKAYTASQVVFDLSQPLSSWGGDLLGWYPEPWFFGLGSWALLAVAAPFMAWGVWTALRGHPALLRDGLLAVLAFGAVFAIWFRLRDVGWYFHFKTLAFIAPLAVTLAVTGLGRLGRRAGGVVIAVWLLAAVSAANQELGRTFDQLPKHVLALRSIDAALPPGRSVRLDIDPNEQNWVAYMLHGQPLCSRRPLLHTSYPHVPISRKADFILVKHDDPPPADALGGPVRAIEAFTLYRERPSVPGRANCSQRMVQTVTEIISR
jgi:hypothetical protein